jgi:glycosyltransferase 2 family protein
MARAARLWMRVGLPLGISGALLWVVFRTLDSDGLIARGLALDWRWLLVAALLGPLQVWLGGVRWARVCRALGVPMQARRAVAEVGLSTALNQVLPAGVAGDALRVWRQRAHGAAVVVETVVVDRALGLASLLAVAAVGAAAVPGGLWVVAPVVAGAAALVAAPTGGGFRRVLREDGWMQAGISGLLTVSFVVGFVAAGLSVQIPPGMWALTGVPLLLLAMAVPLSVGGWGPRELSAAVVWPLMGGTSEEGVALSMAYGLSVLLGALPGVVFWAWRSP